MVAPEWSELDDLNLTDYVFETNLSYVEVAQKMLVTEREIRGHIKRLGIGWVRRRKGAASRGQAALTAIMRKLIPGEEIRCEEPIGERLRLDVYCPKYKLAAEYNGIQHYEYVDFFHRDAGGFQEHKIRDERKQEICNNLGIALVVFRYNDDLSEEAVYTRLLDAIRSTPHVGKETKSLKGQPHYEHWKQYNRERNRKAYKRMKDRPKSGN